MIFWEKAKESQPEPLCNSNDTVMGFALFQETALDVEKFTGMVRTEFGQQISIEISDEKYLDGDKKMAKTSGLNDFGYPDVCFFNIHLEPASDTLGLSVRFFLQEVLRQTGIVIHLCYKREGDNTYEAV